MPFTPDLAPVSSQSVSGPPRADDHSDSARSALPTKRVCCFVCFTQKNQRSRVLRRLLYPKEPEDRACFDYVPENQIMPLRRLSVGERRTLVRHVFFPILLLCALFTYTLLLFQKSLAVTGCDAGPPTATLVFTGVLETNATLVRLPKFIYNRNSIRKLLINSLEDRNASDVTTDLPKLRRDLTWSKRLPQALIIGVKKGGTRALLEFLRLHPDVRAPGPEVHFFDRFYDNGLEWYRRQMPSSLEGQLTIEKTPSYFITPEVPSRVHKMSPSIKLVVVVRDPVTRAVSDYTQAVSKHPETKSFEEMAFLNLSTGLLDTSWSAIRIGVYAKHLDKWFQYFPANQLHFVSGERLISDPVGEMAKVQRFLGLVNVITDKHFYFNETKGFPCLKKSEGNGNPHCLGKTKGRAHPKVQTGTVHRLRDFYRPFNAKFFQMVGQNFGWG